MAVSQSNAIKHQAEQALAVYHQNYQLNTEQQAQVLELQQQHFQKEAQLAELKNKDFDRYITKKVTLRKMTESSIFKLLDEKQQAIFLKKQQERTQKEAALRVKLQKQGAGKAEIKKALLDLN